MLDENGHAIPIPDKTPSLYAYLPMEDRRYLFPFYINADFELSSNRQNAKQVSVWNEFLFYNIGKSIVSWVSTLASKAHPSYLSLLPKELLTEELEESKVDKLAKQFNRGYTESLVTTPFILNDKNEVVCQSDIIIDESGFADIIGASDFCDLYRLNKRLINSEINIEPLKISNIFSGIEHLQTSNVVERILDKKNRISILRYWLSISKELRFLMLNHIANMPGNRKNLDDQIADIPAFTSKERLYSFNKLLTSRNIILRTDTIKGIEEILLKCIADFRMMNQDKFEFTYECPICFETSTNASFLINMCSCKHKCCLNCWKDHCMSVISNTHDELHCFECQEVIPHNRIVEHDLVPSDKLNKSYYTEKHTNQYRYNPHPIGNMIYYQIFTC